MPKRSPSGTTDLIFRNKDLRILGLRGFIYKPPRPPKSPKIVYTDIVFEIRILGIDFRNEDLRILGLRGFIYKPPKPPKSPKKIPSRRSRRSRRFEF